MEDIIFNVFQYLPIKDICSCVLVSSIFYRVYNKNLLWKYLLERDYQDKWKGLMCQNYCEIYILYKKMIKLKRVLPIYSDIVKLFNNNELHLDSKSLNYLPKEIGSLVNLQTVNCYGNYLRTLPKEIVQLINLRILNLSSNKLCILPKEICQLVNLEILNLTKNKLENLPTEIGNLVNLQYLYFV